MIKKREDSLMETIIDDEIVVMNIDSGEFFSLSGTAREIWQLIDREQERDDIIERLSRTYPSESRADIAAQVSEFLANLREAKLIDWP